MNKQDVIDFFDKCAPTWDAEMIKNDTIINRILDNAEVGEGMSVLDVACGTGVMFDYYLNRGVSEVVGIDISGEMAAIASAKFASDPRVRVVCGDVEEFAFDRKFDRIVVYNAFPHFQPLGLTSFFLRFRPLRRPQQQARIRPSAGFRRNEPPPHRELLLKPFRGF